MITRLIPSRRFSTSVLIVLCILPFAAVRGQPEALFGIDEDPVKAGHQSAWFGTLETAYYPWVRHDDLGWLWAVEVDAGGVWLYAGEGDWVWTTASTYPNLYRTKTGAWLYHYEGQGWVFDHRAHTFWDWQEAPDARTTTVHATFWTAQSKFRRRVGEIGTSSRYPTDTDGSVDGKWRLVKEDHWTSGFWPGCLWLMNDYSGADYWQDRARDWTQRISTQTEARHHDLGFMFLPSFGHAYRMTGETEDRDTVLQAAETLANEYNPLVGMTRSWSWGDFAEGNRFTVIIDNMMNLELLFWGANQAGGDPSWKTMAHQHALRCAEEFIREDGTAYHVVIFDETTGGVMEKRTWQGYADESTWARGQAWGIYGFTMAYRETGDQRLLAAAMKLTDFFLNNLPADKVPYWDFEYPFMPTSRDSSAAAIAASGLLELSDLMEDRAQADIYYDAALAILDSLMSDTYSNPGWASNALLAHGTASFPHGNSDTGLIYGDYYFIEALLRYLRW